MTRASRKYRNRPRDDGAQLASRLIRCVPAATVELETFCKMAGIKVSSRVPTAAVECVRRPHLLINPEFAAKHCARDEHLFLLVMHELWHVILAHTRLYPRVTPAHNIAFDAIINAGLARQYKTPEYRGFFEELNPADKFPHILLRPPVGWPDDPHYPEDIGPAGTRRILERLYPPPGEDAPPLPFYDEIFRLLFEYAKENGWVWVEGDPFLLGDHDDPEAEEQALDDSVFGEAIRQVSGSMPPLPLGGRGQGGRDGERQVQIDPTTEQVRRVFSNVLRRCLGPRRGKHRRRVKSLVPGIGGASVLPNPRDRLAPARRCLGVPNTIWNQPGKVKARVPETPAKAHVYLDVSGSMGRVLPHLLSLITPYVVGGQAEVYQFSTRVRDLSLADLRQGKVRTTGGTNINCVLQHIVETETRLNRVLILTDGAVGAPHYDLVEQVRARNMRICVVMPAEAAWEDDLRDLANLMVTLPPVGVPGSTWRR
ncbi:MAG: VWA domain-containing protein [Anaerolineaceae bacterium]|nr:VWA domain-containing protein [Anaerolineaceae bacterium]